jgi:two-component SAPR family response regulator
MKAILIDDERLALNHLEKRLAKLGQVEIVGKHMDPRKGIEQIGQEDVDVVFLDIHMPELNGLELAEQLLAIKPFLNIVFVTAYDHFAVQAFELNALDYVVKPVSMERLKKTTQRVRDRLGIKDGETAVGGKPVKLNMFRQFAVEANDGQMSAIQWRTAKAQELFLYILQHRGQMVRKSFLVEMLWPEFEPAKAYPQLYTTVYHIRKTLSQFGERFHIANSLEGYVLHIQNVLLDVDQWEQHIVSGTPLTQDTIQTHREMMKLNDGEYLQEYDYWWAEPERHRIKLLWLRAALQIAAWYDSRQADEAIACYEEIYSRHPLGEEAYFALMKLYASAGNHVSVVRQYRLLTDTLMEELNEHPSSYITEWWEEWKKSSSSYIR